MIKLFDNKNEKNTNITILSLTKSYTKELTMFYFSFYNWREIAKVKAKTKEILKELGVI